MKGDVILAIVHISIAISIIMTLISIGILIADLTGFIKNKPCESAYCEQETITYFPPEEE